MRTHFIHAADIHLGYEQYNLPARANDFARAYIAMVEYAIEHEVEFVLMAGDLFHRSNPDAWTLTQASTGLKRLREAGIPVIAIEGNHDTQYSSKNLSWMEFLCDEELLILLNVAISPDGTRTLVSFAPGDRRGSWFDVAGARVYGMKYFGAMTPRMLEDVGPQVEASDYTIFMLHAGMHDQIPHMHGGLTANQLDPLRGKTDYLALGHIHKRLELEDWIFNPGSLETVSTDEMQWPHGFFEVTVDSDSLPQHQVVGVDTPSLRPFVRIAVSSDGLKDAVELASVVEEKIGKVEPSAVAPVVELYLHGVAHFPRQELPLDRLRLAIEQRLAPLALRIRNNLVPPGLISPRQGDQITRAELERGVIEQLVYQNSSYRDSGTAWARLVLDVKNMAAEKDLPSSIVQHVESRIAAMSQERESDQAEKPATIDEKEPVPAERKKRQLEDIPDLYDEGVSEPPGGEPPCLLPLFEDW